MGECPGARAQPSNHQVLKEGLVMSKPNRREFVQLSAGTLAVGLCPRLAGLSASSGTFGLTPAQSDPENSADKGNKPLRLGLYMVG